MTIFVLHISFCLIIFIVMFLYANVTSFEEKDLDKDWDQIKPKFKDRLKQDYFLKKQTEFIFIRLKFLDNSFLKNSIQVEPVLGYDNKIKFSGRTDLKTFGFIVFLMLTFVCYIGAIYMYMIIKKARKRTVKEMQFMANLSGTM